MHHSNPYASKKPDFSHLATKYPAFAPFVTTSAEGFSNIDWQDVRAVRALNQALLKDDWQLEVEMMEDRLCPPVPNRLDYLFHLIDLEKYGPTRDGPLSAIDIGTGAMAIYPLLLHRLRPDSRIIATEKDADSLGHARKVLEANSIPSESIKALAVPDSAGILFPLLDDDNLQVDFTMCNPPFFASDQEMQQGIDLKEDKPHAGPTAAAHELVTEGGEVAFISQMIQESLTIRQRCTWYTSLVGRYASLAQLVTHLKREKIDNYYIIPSQPARTVRWILIWSHGLHRLPDRIFRAPNIPTTLLPSPNTQRYVSRPHRSHAELRESIIPFFEKVNIEHTTLDPIQGEDGTILEIRARGNTWSRAARRKLQLQLQDQSQNPDTSSSTATQTTPITLRATLRFLDGSIEMDWTYGSNRADIDSLWKSMLANSGLVDRSSGRTAEPEPAHGQGKGSGSGEKRPAEEEHEARKEMRTA